MDTIKKTPFRKGSVREKAFQFLQKEKTYRQFINFAVKEGVSAPNLLRFLRKIGIEEQNGKIKLSGGRDDGKNK